MQKSDLPVAGIFSLLIHGTFRCNYLRISFMVLLACAGGSAFAQTSILTQHNDNARTGQNTAETILNTTNVNTNQFGKLFALPVVGQVYAQPLYVPGVTINGGVHNVVIIATEADSVYAYDADSTSAVLLWKASMVDMAHGAGNDEMALESATTIGCSDMQPQIGITSTPVIDLTSKTIYVEAKSTDGLNYFHRLHALDLLTGNEKTPGPVVIAATVSGTGDGSTNGQIVFNSNNNALHQLNRPGLLLLNSTIYIAYGSHCDDSPYHGWLFAYDEATFARKSVYVTTPNGGLGGFWMGGAGVAADASGNIFIASGNGDFDTTHVPAKETGDTLLKLGTTSQILTQLDYFTPWEQATLQADDRDLGSGGVLLLPDQPGTYPHILVGAGKEGIIYVVNRDQMTAGNSHYCSGCTSDPEIIEESVNKAVGGMFTVPTYWNNTLYFWGVNDVLKSIPLTNGLPDFTHITGSTPQIGFPGAGISVSSNGTTAGTAIVWAIDGTQYGSPGPGPGPAVLYAYDATNVPKMLYSSAQNAARDAAGNAVKFALPSVANGKVYVGTSAAVDVYGLIGGVPPPPTITNLSATSGPVGTAVTINGTNFGSTQGTSTVTFNGTAATVTSWSSSSLSTSVPTGATTGNVVVTVGGVASNGLNFTVTTAAPVITSGTTASGTVGVAFSYQITATNSPTSYGATGLPAGLSVNTASGLISGTPSGAGTSTVTLSATNGGGTGHATLTLTITAAAPVITSITTASGTVGTAFSYQITATNSPTSYGATGLPAGLSVNTSSGLISGTPSGAGTSTVTLSATNGGGTGHATLTLTISTVVTVSSVQVVAAAAPGSASTLSLSFAQNTVAGDLILVAFDYDTNATPSSVTDSQGNVFTPIGNQLTSPGGARSRVYYAKNIKGGADRVTVNLSANSGWLELYLSEYTGVDQTNPVDAQAGASGGAGAVTSGNGTTTVAGDVIYGYCVADWACTAGSGFITRSNLNANLIEDELAGNAGTYAATGSANNGWSMQMVALKPASSGVGAPVITSGTTASGTVGVAFSYQITATNSPTSYGATGLPAGLSVNTSSGLISGTPTGAGTSTVTLSATNGSGTGHATLTLTITAAAPVITSTTTASGTVGVAFSYQITATNSPTSYGATGLPAGLSVNTSSGLISGTPSGAGTSTVTLSATNSGGTGHATLTLTISTVVTVSSVQVVAAAAPGSASTLSLSFAQNTVAGDLILVAFDYDTNATPSSVTDSQGNVFTPIGNQLTSPGGARSRVYYAKNIKGGADRVTVNLSANSGWLELYLSEYTGVDQTNPIDAQAGASGGAGAVTSGNGTTSAVGDVIYGYCVGDWVCTAGSGFATRSNLNGNLIEDRLAGTAGTYAATGSANNGWSMQMIALKAE